ncbi:MAG: helix-turn-helix domain-containing protein [Lachnospiraceae bacterium]|nr:helix-turn-helix domain-containing protein [Lachnospiraceae bacterium]
MKIVGFRLKNAIYKAGYRNMETFANACGVSRNTVSCLCNDKYKYTVSEYTISQFCKVLDVTPEYLAGIDTPDEKPMLDILMSSGKLEMLENGSYSLNNVELTEKELQNVLQFLMKKVIDLCDDYIEIRALSQKDMFVR